MKTRESGMPEEDVWATFFDVAAILDRLGPAETCRDAVEFGCGYGTFTIPVARRIRGTIYAVDIEPAMTRLTAAKADAAGLTNVTALVRDFMTAGTGCADASVDYVMLFNILHAEDPSGLLREAGRVLRPAGLLGVMHWNYDPATPRGPSLDIRPRPEQCRDWALAAGFRLQPPGIADLPPYHYGMLLAKE